ncbi:hypothetical protein Agub_g5861 [Astrephomene gubernaculifera]|uniref:SET domain-containing protein n=1 Tax=Astrephomene gubernaculifera TaxID=47775 RepID=A0AAD3HKE6_9CHLO|nr:hypothetical protein Agub_g5861 [Astrephomene gubernaculifera]
MDGTFERYEPHMEEQYNSAGCLMVTDPCGVHECGETCTSAACRRNKQLSQGVALPLEVFMTASKGWGVRCREDIPAGAFVCCYVGQLVTDSMAEVRKGADHYLFDLDFFTHVYAEIKEKGLDAIKEEIPVHKIPPVPNMELVRQIQANAAAAVRAARQREAATATTATVEASSAAAKGAAAAGSAAASGGPASAASGPDVGVSEGVMAPAEVAAAARGLLASCRAIAAADDSGAAAAAAAAGPSSAAAPMTAEAATAAPAALGGSAAKCAALQSAAATAAEAAAEDPGAFYLQPIFSRDEAGVPAGAAGTSSEGAVEGADGDEYAPVLVIDAQGTGNVGRFINHSCSGNLTIQAVFAGHFRNTMLYHVGLYAMENIPKFAELTYNYGYHSKSSQAGRDGVYGMKCCCGHPQCIGQLM